MANLSSRTLFFVTSPRSPMKMRPEIKLLGDLYTGKRWNKATQLSYIKELSKLDAFKGEGSATDPAFSARDRINRAPKAFGFVDISPTIKLTDPGKALLDDDIAEEALLRQLLKFQLPSPFHKETKSLKGLFSVKPFLEIFRLIDELGNVSFDELMIFGMQLTHYERFNDVVAEIKNFRIEKARYVGRYKEFRQRTIIQELSKIYVEEISSGKTHTRESRDTSKENFIRTKASNLRDYTDACFRYLRATGLVAISQRGHSLSIIPEKLDEVKFFLRTIDRRPQFENDERSYKKSLYDASLPTLYTDNRENLEKVAIKHGVVKGVAEAQKSSTVLLKKRVKAAVEKRKNELIRQEVAELKTFAQYDSVMETYDDLIAKKLYDEPLMLEWNTWRAMTMLDGGDIKANLTFDDNGQPLSTAGGKLPDIVCDYGDFSLTVEVTMSSGHKQFEMEGESIFRHLGMLKSQTGKEAYCLFIAPKINSTFIPYVYSLYRTNIPMYGGQSIVIPIELDLFRKMIERSHTAGYVPSPDKIRLFCEFARKMAKEKTSDQEWYTAIKEKAADWLAA